MFRLTFVGFFFFFNKLHSAQLYAKRNNIKYIHPSTRGMAHGFQWLMMWRLFLFFRCFLRFHKLSCRCEWVSSVCRYLRSPLALHDCRLHRTYTYTGIPCSTLILAHVSSLVCGRRRSSCSFCLASFRFTFATTRRPDHWILWN